MPSKKKIAVVGATGRVGSPTVEILRERGHEVVPVSRTTGVDVVTGDGLGEALDGVELIIDAATGPSPDQEEATEFFETSACNLHQAAAERGVAEILVVSIIGCEHFSTGFYGAKVAHERAHVEGPVPVRILRAGQFHEYVAEMVKWGIQGDTAYVAEMRTPAGRRRDGRRGARRPCRRSRRRAPRQPRVGSRRPPRGEPRRRGEAAGRQARRRAGDPGRRGPGRPWAAGALLPGPIAKLAGPTFEEWLNA